MDTLDKLPVQLRTFLEPRYVAQKTLRSFNKKLELIKADTTEQEKECINELISLFKKQLATNIDKDVLEKSIDLIEK